MKFSDTIMTKKGDVITSQKWLVNCKQFNVQHN